MATKATKALRSQILRACFGPQSKESNDIQWGKPAVNPPSETTLRAWLANSGWPEAKQQLILSEAAKRRA